ncbi:uncharacterized protein [Diadema setosum]|uniref:uncharacterized protein n=1 Tax=Diadema setosum TaxID=31175 RepID=UPI003B3B6462
MIYNSLSVMDVRLSCLPYLPRLMPSHRCPVLDVCIFKHIKGVEEFQRHYEERMSRVRQPSDRLVFLLSKFTDDMRVTCSLNGSDEDSKYARRRPPSGAPHSYSLQSEEETNVGDMIKKLSLHNEIPEDDRQKSHGPEQESAKDDLLLVEKRIDHHGGELRNETFGISLSIPPGALVEGTSEIITLTILTEKPEDLKLRDDEMIVSYGFRCSPPGLKFLAPVRLTIPHCAVLTDPAKVETVLYLSDENGKPVNIGRRIAVVFDDGQSQESGYRRITSSGKASSFQGQS